MELADLQELLAHPESLDTGTLPLLKELLEQYPYFQTAWVLYLKNLYKIGDPAFKEELRRGALYVADLSVLFYYIEGERFMIQKHKAESAEDEDSAGDRTLDLIDRFLSDTPEQPVSDSASKDIPVPVEMPGDYTSVLLSEVTEEEETQAAQLHGHELIDQYIEDVAASPSENILDLVSEEPSVSEEPQHASQTSDDAEREMSDELPEEETASGQENGSEESYFTETLAKIYVRQQRYDKALEIIKKLNLKYPKKNAYFADQIRFLEKLIINAKSK